MAESPLADAQGPDDTRARLRALERKILRRRTGTRPARSLKRRQVVFLHGSTIAATLTGVIYAWMKYFMTSDDEFAVVNHPWQPTMLHLHILAVPFLVFGFGWIFTNHIWPKYRSPKRERRRSGLLLMLLIVPMTFSGYLLQVVTGERALEWSTFAHWGTSALFVVGYLIHQFMRRD